MTREQRLRKIFEKVDPSKKELVDNLICHVCFLEKQLEELCKYPFIKIHPTNSDLQKVTPASKQYKELMQTYNNSIKVLNSILSKDVEDEEDEFDKWLKEARS